MRGKVEEQIKVANHRRITPAYAGKRRGMQISTTFFKDHPRVCGEKNLKVVEGKNGMGSPPRMRGKAIGVRGRGTANRITPAYAGKRVNIPSIASLGWDHPRVCGEKSIISCVVVTPMGSPPRMRGKVPTRYG